MDKTLKLLNQVHLDYLYFIFLTMVKNKFKFSLEKLLPSPFTIAILLSVFTFLLAFFFGKVEAKTGLEKGMAIMEYWQEGLWNNALLVFAVQMMLMLVLGHSLALSPIISKWISAATKLANNTSSAAFLVCLSTLIVAYFNWGLGLVFGAIFARKVAEEAKKNLRPLNYPLIGAAGYSGLMVWHGGISGSSLIKVSENNHLKEMMAGLSNQEFIEQIPQQIGFEQTVFSSMNIYAIILSLLLLPAFLYWLGKRQPGENKFTVPEQQKRITKKELKIIGAEKLDHSKILSKGIGLLLFSYSIFLAVKNLNQSGLDFINPNYINFSLLALCLLAHRNLASFLSSIDEAIGGAAGILIQFPLYFGIMGIMKGSGLVILLSDFFVAHSTENTLPIYTLFSAAIVNVFVPSGGGQWAIQGPIIIQASQDLEISLPKCILAMAYGDQLTNMLQPFWALPLLGITGLKAKQLIPYTLLLMGIGSVIYCSALLLF